MSEETPPPEAAGRRNGADDGVDVPAPERVEELRRTLTRWNTEYYAGDPTVSDADFDAAMRELADLEAAHPELAADDSPTNVVGATSANATFAEVGHAVPMMSIDNAMSVSYTHLTLPTIYSV